MKNNFIYKLSVVFLFFILFAAFSSSASADEKNATADSQSAQAEYLGVKEPKLLPDSPFYFLKTWGRSIRSLFVFNKLSKLELKEKFSSEKILELRKLVETMKNPSVLNKAIESYKKELDGIKDQAEKLKDQATTNPEISKFLEKFAKHQALQQGILEKLEKQVPPEVLEKIKEARQRHLDRFKEVMEKLGNKEEAKNEINKLCTEQWNPVCGANGVTYSNECFAALNDVKVASQGKCKTQGQQTQTQTYCSQYGATNCPKGCVVRTVCPCPPGAPITPKCMDPCVQKCVKI